MTNVMADQSLQSQQGKSGALCVWEECIVMTSSVVYLFKKLPLRQIKKVVRVDLSHTVHTFRGTYNQPTSSGPSIVPGRNYSYVSTHIYVLECTAVSEEGGGSPSFCIQGSVDICAYMLWVHRPAHEQTFANKCLRTDGLR